MKKFLAVSLLLMGVLSFSVAYARYTNSYFRKDGTFVNGYYNYHSTDKTGYDSYNFSLPASNNAKTATCLDTTNGFLSTDGKCYCNTGYSWDNIENQCTNYNLSSLLCAEFQNTFNTQTSNLQQYFNPYWTVAAVKLTYSQKLSKCIAVFKFDKTKQNTSSIESPQFQYYDEEDNKFVLQGISYAQQKNYEPLFNFAN